METRWEASASMVQVREGVSEGVMTEIPRGLADRMREKTEVTPWFGP